jgi:hypothetical protein
MAINLYNDILQEVDKILGIKRALKLESDVRKLIKVVLNHGIAKNHVIEEEKRLHIFDKLIIPDMQVIDKSSYNEGLKYLIEIKRPRE